MADTVARWVRSDCEGVCTLTLNRPEKLNALDTQAFEELDAHLQALEQQTEQIGCVVLRGAGRAFCAGADLAAMGSVTVAPDYKPGVIARLAQLPQPVIAAVHGVCYTGALELALACDFILADATARFADTHGKWGLVSAWGMMQRLPRRIGHAAAKRLMMTGTVLTAEQAQCIGLIDILVDEGALEHELHTFTQSILANSWHTNVSIKRLMRETDAMSLGDALEYEQRHYPGNAADHAARLARFSKT